MAERVSDGELQAMINKRSGYRPGESMEHDANLDLRDARAELREYEAEADGLRHEEGRLEAENARLREALGDAYGSLVSIWNTGDSRIAEAAAKRVRPVLFGDPALARLQEE